MLNFPNAPSDGETSAQPNGITYQWSATKERWTSVASLGSPEPPEPGSVVGEAHFQTGALATGSNGMPNDNTIPQVSEGDQFMALSYTPKFSTSLLKIGIVYFGASSNGARARVTSAIFRDGAANAIAAGMSRQHDNISNLEFGVTYTHWEPAVSKDPTEFTLRIGGDSGGIITFNGASSARLLGGVMASSISITEIAQ